MENALLTIMHKFQDFDKPILAAIDGRCAAGKTTLAAHLQKETGCSVIHMDHFFLRPEQRTAQRMHEAGGNVDYERFIEEVMMPFKRREKFAYRQFDCREMKLSSEIVVEPNEITIVEGSYSCHPALWDSYDMHIFLDVDADEQLRRISRRNGEEKASQFRERWIPLEEKYFDAYHIQERCEMVFHVG